jgi:hypothetical protein
VDYIVAPLTGGGAPIIAFFKASNLQFINYAFLNQPDVGWCAYSNGYIYTSKDDADSILKYQVSWNTILNHPTHHDGLINRQATVIRNSNNAEITLRNMQGGEFTPSGDRLYVSCGIFYVLVAPSDGIHVFNTTNWKEIKRSTNSLLGGQQGCFDYRFNNDAPWGEEPEGLTIWDLDNTGVTSANGQLHVLLDDHNIFTSNKVILKHYKRFKCPSDITVIGTTVQGEPKTNSIITNFLNQGTTYANCASISSDAPAVFPPGKTGVTFTITDNVTNEKVTCIAYVTVINKQDECSIATRIYACDKTIADNYCASGSANVPTFLCNVGSAKDVWFVVYPPSSVFSVETFQIAGGLTDLDIQAFSGTCGNLHEIACDDSSGDDKHAKIVFQNLPSSKPIYIRVTDHDGTHFGRFGIYTQKIAMGNNIFNEAQFVSGDGAGVHEYPTLTGDVNGDGKTDLIFIFQHSNGSGLNIRTKLSDGDGTYRNVTQVLGDGAGVHQYPTLAGDVNGDGKTDLIFIFQHSNGSGLNIRTKLSNGDGTYRNVTQALGDGAGVHQYPTLAGDVNGDGKTDLIFIFQHLNGSGLNIRTKLSNGDGTYTNITQVFGDGAGIHQYPTLTGDVNGDGKTDVIFIFQHLNGTGLNIRTKLSNGDGTYTNVTQIMGDGGAVHDYPTLTGDVDGDGKADLIFTGQNWTSCGLNIRVKRSNGNGTWCAAWQGMGDGGGVYQYPTLTGDVNADGKTDLIYVFQDNTQGLILRTKIAQATNLCQPGSNIPQQIIDPFIVYPNPTNGLVQIAANDPGEFEVIIFDMNGRVLFPVQKFTTSVQFDLSALSSGIYFADIYDTITKKRVRKKIVLMR